MQNAGEDTREACNKLNDTMKATFDGIQSKIAVFKLNVEDKLDESFARMSENGILDSLAASLCNLVAFIITQFNNIVNKLVAQEAYQ